MRDPELKFEALYLRTLSGLERLGAGGLKTGACEGFPSPELQDLRIG